MTATPGPGQVTVSWTPPAGDIDYYTATADPGGATCTGDFGVDQCTITNLTPGTPYTFTVACTDDEGTTTGEASAATDAVTPTDAPAPIPTLSAWGLLASAGLLGLLGARRQRQQGRGCPR